MRTDILEKREEILQWIAEEQPKRYICEQLNCKQDTLNAYLIKMGIEYEGQMAKKGQFKGTNKYKSVYEYLDNSTSIKSHILRKKLIEEGIKEERCELCGLAEWQGIKIPLELHHKDTNHYNNSLENLQILCPNCHAIQEGNSGAAIGTKKVKAEPVKKEKKIPICPQCGKEFSGEGKVCVECGHKNQRVVERPNRDTLKQEIRTVPFLQLAAKYGVSDNAIKKWCIAYQLPHKKVDIRAYSDEDWALI